MSKKINHYKLESLRKECDAFLAEREELLSWYKDQSKVKNTIETKKELRSMMFKLNDEMIITKSLRQLTLNKLKQDDYNISKGVVELLDIYDSKVDELSRRYFEQVQKMDLLVRNLEYEFQKRREEEAEKGIETEKETEEISFFSEIAAFLSHNIKIVFVVIMVIVLLIVFKYIVSDMIEKTVNKIGNQDSPLISGELDF